MTVLGSRSPRLRAVPPYTESRGQDAIDIAAMAGLVLDPWQQDVLMDMCAVDERGRWATLENTLIVGRQNGKGAIIEALALASLFVWDDQLVMYSAHRFDTAQQMFKRIRDLVDGCSALSRRVRRIYEGNGKERVELKTGAELKFLTRSDAAARGFSGDRAFADEAFKLDSAMMGAILPTMSARPNPHVSYFSSAGWEISEQLGKLRRRAVAALLWGLVADGRTLEEAAAELGVDTEDGKALLARADGPHDPSLCFLEWSVPETTQRLKSVMGNTALWAMANPALGGRLSERFTQAELRSMSTVEFARERLGIGDYPPDEDDDGWGVIAEAEWVRLVHPDGGVRPGESGGRRPAFAVDVTPDRSRAAIGAVYEDEDGQLVAEVIAHRQGVGWVVPRLVELIGKYDPVAVALDTVGPASSLIPDLDRTLEQLDAAQLEAVTQLEVLELSTSDIAQAYGQFHEHVTDTKRLRHLDQEPLNEAVRAAGTRPLGDRVTWDRRGADGDITPLVAVTNALHAHIRTAHLAVDVLDGIW